MGNWIVARVASWNELRNLAVRAAHKSYSPYSSFPVAAVLATHAGDVFIGVNVENRSFGCTMCAEACAIANMVSHRATKDDPIRRVVVFTPQSTKIRPCGKCLQMISEFSAPDISCEVMCSSNAEDIILPLQDLLPHPFVLDRNKKVD